VSEDGKFLITVQRTKSSNYLVRQYKLPTGELVNERLLSDAGDLWNVDIVFSGIAHNYELVGVAEDGKWSSYPFILEDR
jgi:hypothetical protein